jgi:hypothetical protein
MVKQDLIEPSGYYQIPVAIEDRPNTAFSFPGGGLWQFKRMPMGLSNSAPVFETFWLFVLATLLTVSYD